MYHKMAVRGLVAIVALLFVGQSVGGASAFCGSSEKSHNFYFGKASATDRLLYEETFDFSYKFLRTRTEDVKIPQNGVSKGVITYMEVLDQRSDGKGGCVYINKGGIGQSFVELRLKSSWNRDMSFLVLAYGS